MLCKTNIKELNNNKHGSVCVCVCACAQGLMWRLWSIRTSASQFGMLVVRRSSGRCGDITTLTHRWECCCKHRTLIVCVLWSSCSEDIINIVCVCLQGLIFVVDSNDPERIKEASEELHTLVKRFKLSHSFVFPSVLHFYLVLLFLFQCEVCLFFVVLSLLYCLVFIKMLFLFQLTRTFLFLLVV